MNLENNLYLTDKFVELEQIIGNVKENITFCGSRYVYIQGEKETFSIHILAKRVMELMKQTRFEYTDEEREAGKKIAASITRIYEDNDERLKRKFFITRFFCYIIDQINAYSPRFDWRYEHKKFDYYTKKQYEETFNSKPKKHGGVCNTLYIDIGLHVVLYHAPEKVRISK